jgi:hypothetical protein
MTNIINFLEITTVTVMSSRMRQLCSSVDTNVSEELIAYVFRVEKDNLILEWDRRFVIDPRPSKMHNGELVFIMFYP